MVVFFLFFLFFVTGFAKESKEVYKDLGKDHWAYSAVESLINNGILKQEGEFFNGDQKISRSEMVVYLSKALNKLEDEKASKDDLLIIENLIYEFSKELNEYGFNVEKYVNKIKEIEENIEKNRVMTEAGITKNSELERRVAEIEKILGEKDNKKEKIDLLRYSELLIESGIAYGKNIYNTKDTNEYRKIYKLEYKLNYKDYEAGIKISDKFNEKEDIMFLAKGEKKLGNYLFGFHTKGYMESYNSYYDNVEYLNYQYKADNTNSTALPYKEEFASNGIKFGNKYMFTSLENTEDKNYAISGIESKFLKSLIIYNLNDKKIDYEGSLRLPVYKDRVSIGGGYSGVEKDVNTELQAAEKVDLNYINGDMDLKIGGNNYNIGYEKKIADKSLYDCYYGKALFDLTEKTTIFYKGEIVEPSTLDKDRYINHYIILKTKFYGFDIYANYNIYGFDKDKFVLKGIIDNFNSKNYATAGEYTEMMTKAKYTFFNKLETNIGYRVIDSKKDKSSIIFSKIAFMFDSDTQIYLKYLKNDSSNIYSYNDMKRDLNGNRYNIDFDESSAIIPGFKNGVAEIGMKLKF